MLFLFPFACRFDETIDDVTSVLCTSLVQQVYMIMIAKDTQKVFMRKPRALFHESNS